MQTRPARFLPEALAKELRLLPRRILGLLLLSLTFCCWLALISWSYADPSPNFATGAQPQNWVGRWGASLADGLLLAFGLAAPLLALPFAALGMQFAAARRPIQLKARFFFWLCSLAALPAFFATFPIPARWILPAGLGGGVGDFAALRAARLLSALPPPLLWPAVALLFLLLGFWFLLRACGVSARDFALAFSSFAAMEYAPEAENSFATGQVREGSSNRFTRWAGRLPLTDHTLVPWPNRARQPLRRRQQPLGFPEGEKLDSGERPRGAFAAEASAHASSGSNGNSSNGVFDDLRIEPFFGPRPRSDSGHGEGPAFNQERGPASPFRRLPGKTQGSALPAGSESALERFANRLKDRRPRFDRLKHKEPECGQMWRLPSTSLLAQPARTNSARADELSLRRRSSHLMGVLEDYGFRGRISQVHPGPVVTLFEFEPAPGTKSSKVVGLADDIARSMRVSSARVSTISGRDAIGIELPNPAREIVVLRSILEAPAFQDPEAALPLGLGKSIAGEPLIADLAKMPHLLIAGTTGSGKSVGINAMILSLIFRLPPSHCCFLMIDPKMLELPVYDGIPHMLAPVFTDPNKAVAALKWAVKEMTARYRRMSALGARNIASYNAKVAALQLRGRSLSWMAQRGEDPGIDRPVGEEAFLEPAAMPYIVIVIDEFADLIMVAGREAEFTVQRLAQMARAAGIHLIMATQRAGVDVITGTIKANFPSRISYKVASRIDSRVILGEQGAEQLLGDGDLLYLGPAGQLIRAHGPFVSDDEIEAVANSLKIGGSSRNRPSLAAGEAFISLLG